MAALFASERNGSGLSMSPDSVMYLTTSRFIAELGGLQRDYTTAPPLFPMLLSMIPLEAHPWGFVVFNVVCFALTGLLTAHLFARHWTALIALLTMIAAPPLPYVHQWLWTEAFFITLVTLFWVAAQRGSIGLMTAAVMLACFQRYSGLVLLPVGLLVLLMERKPPRAVILLLLSLLPIGAWMARNVLGSGTGPLGVRPESVMGWGESALSTGLVLSTWLPFLLAGLLARAELRPSMRAALAAYAVGHIALVVYGSATTRLDAPDNRLLAPAFIPLLLLSADGGRQVAEFFSLGTRRRATRDRLRSFGSRVAFGSGREAG